MTKKTSTRPDSVAGLRGLEPADVISRIFVARSRVKRLRSHNVRLINENFAQYSNGFPKMTFWSSSPLGPATQSVHTNTADDLVPILSGVSGLNVCSLGWSGCQCCAAVMPTIDPLRK